MHHTQRSYYEVKFAFEFLKRTGTEFQNFFSEIMEKAYPGDFQRVRPWGNLGDRKNDGYLKSKRCLFQVYAPNEMKLKPAINKIDEDFQGALPYWRVHFDTWVFVHNAYHGLSGDVLKKLLDIEAAHSPVSIARCGFEELRLEVFGMEESALASLLGPAPSDRDMMRIGFEDLRPVLISIARNRPRLDESIQAPPPDKIEINGLSEHVEDLLKLGMQRADLVRRFFQSWPDPTLGESVAEAFTNEYKSLKAQGLEPDQIFWELQMYAGGEQVPNPAHQSSVLAVLAYLFEMCHIFESPRTAYLQ